MSENMHVRRSSTERLTYKFSPYEVSQNPRILLRDREISKKKRERNMMASDKLFKGCTSWFCFNVLDSASGENNIFIVKRSCLVHGKQIFEKNL